MRSPGAALLLVGIGVNCGGSSSSTGTLDCAWLASDNCWKSTATAATSCLPAASATGTLSADKRTCTYASGSVVTFNPALVLPVPTSPNWNFTVTTGGQPCLSYSETSGGGISLTVMGQTFTETSAGLGISVKCPDGKSYSNANAFELLGCDTGTLGGLPGDIWFSSDTSVSLGLVNTSANSTDSLAVFDCSLP